jgi:hypothetical protein
MLVFSYGVMLFHRAHYEADADNHIHYHSTFSSLRNAAQNFALDVYDSLVADQWIEKNYSHPSVECLLVHNIQGPIACMLRFNEAALCIFGEISVKTLKLAQDLADISHFPVLVRPHTDCPFDEQR